MIDSHLAACAMCQSYCRSLLTGEHLILNHQLEKEVLAHARATEGDKVLHTEGV